VKRRWKVLLGLVGGLIVLLAINTIVVDSETKPASITAEGAQILHLPAGDIQVLETPAESAHPGVPVVLIPCYSCSLHWYDRLAPLLAKNHRVIQLDLLGEGGSAKPANGYSMESEAALVAAALNKLDAQGAVVVGHSLGAAVATSLAQQASQLVDRVVIIDQAPDNSFGGTPFLVHLAHVPVIGEALHRIILDSVVKHTYEAAFAPGYDISSGFDDPNQVVDDYRDMTYTSFNDLSSAEDDFESAEGLDARIRSAAVPLQVIFGTEDQIWDKPNPREAANAYRSVPGAEIHMIKGSGHSPNVEKPDETAALIEKFAAGAGPANPVTIPKKTAKAPPKNPGSACERPRVKEIKALIRSPKPGATVKSPVFGHVASSLSRCPVNASITIDGTPYAFRAPKNAQGGVGPNNPISMKKLHLSGKALRHYARQPSCNSGHSIYFQAELPKGRHILRVSGCPQGTAAPVTVPSSVHFRVR
jgi:pimeloyl-ACP methyl ester carboxylesterase